MEIRPILAPATHDLRLRVLRPGQPPDRADYAADHTSVAFHLGAFTADDTLIGVASFYQEPFLDHPQPQHHWRLRGMAVEPTAQGQGVGRALLNTAFADLHAREATWLWCNARTTAAPFYTTLGFDTIGDPFDMPDIGTHYLMARRVDSPTP
jgi:GNAT superfamily N-acetyltransferase